MTASAVGISPTGKTAIDGLLSGVRWDTGTLSFGFPATASSYGADYAWSAAPEAQDGFAGLSAAQQASVRVILADFASVSNLSFAETLGEGADIRFGRSAVLDKDGSAFAWAYYPEGGGGGNDALAGGTGNDVLIGGGGSDMFIFAPGDGADRILDFTAGTSIDALKLTGGLFASPSAALAAARQAGADVHLDLGTGGVDLVGVRLGDLTTADFFIV